jgi:hypothetical protein
MARCRVDTPGGTNVAMPRRRRQLTAKADTSTSGKADRPPSAPAQNAPTPVGRPSNGVASNPTDRRPGSEVAARSGGTHGALHIAGTDR